MIVQNFKNTQKKSIVFFNLQKIRMISNIPEITKIYLKTTYNKFTGYIAFTKVQRFQKQKNNQSRITTF